MQAQTTFASSHKLVTATVATPVKKTKAVPKVEQLSRVNLKGFIEDMDGLFVSVDYKKLDGSSRTLTGRLGVKAYLRGGDNKVMAADRPYLTMFDLKLRQYRTVDLSTVSEIRALGNVYRIIG